MKPKFNQKFYDTFTKDELDIVLSYSFLVGYDCIVINTELYFFELSADVKDILDIYYDCTKSDANGILTKDEFLKLLQSSQKEKSG